MDSGVASASLVVLLLVVVGYVSVVYFFSPKYDPREPPVLSHYIPYVGHVLGLIRYGQYYFEMLRSVISLSNFSTQFHQQVHEKGVFSSQSTGLFILA